MILPASLLLAASAAAPAAQAAPDLAAFFACWREFQRPRLSRGVPDYTASAMAAQHRELAGWMRKLDGFDAAQQIDVQIVRAEMNGLDFDHRVLRPWARNPDFYVSVFDEQSDQPAREGPHALGAVELWQYRFPLAPAQA